MADYRRHGFYEITLFSSVLFLAIQAQAPKVGEKCDVLQHLLLLPDPDQWHTTGTDGYIRCISNGWEASWQRQSCNIAQKFDYSRQECVMLPKPQNQLNQFGQSSSDQSQALTMGSSDPLYAAHGSGHLQAVINTAGSVNGGNLAPVASNGRKPGETCQHGEVCLGGSFCNRDTWTCNCPDGSWDRNGTCSPKVYSKLKLAANTLEENACEDSDDCDVNFRCENGKCLCTSPFLLAQNQCTLLTPPNRFNQTLKNQPHTTPEPIYAYPGDACNTGQTCAGNSICSTMTGVCTCPTSTTRVGKICEPTGSWTPETHQHHTQKSNGSKFLLSLDFLPSNRPTPFSHHQNSVAVASKLLMATPPPFIASGPEFGSGPGPGSPNPNQPIVIYPVTPMTSPSTIPTSLLAGGSVNRERQVGDSCSRNFDCPLGAYCRNPERTGERNSCRCLSTHVQVGTQCKPIVYPGQRFCEDTLQCNAVYSGAFCSTDGVCRCPSGMVPRGVTCEPDPARAFYGFLPPVSRQLSMEERSVQSLAAPKLQHGHSASKHCTNDDSCTKYGLTGTVCLNGMCQCPQGTLELANGTCFVIPSPMESETRKTGFVTVAPVTAFYTTIGMPMVAVFARPGDECGANIRCMGSVCINGICRCRNGYEFNGHLCIRKSNSQNTLALPNGPCLSGQQCTGNSVCNGSHCECPPGTKPVNNICQSMFVAPLNPCSNETICTGNSMCDGGICRCHRNMILSGNMCIMSTTTTTLPSTLSLSNLGERCVDGRQCSGRSVCQNGVCECQNGWIKVGQECVSFEEEPELAIGDKCSLDNDECGGGSFCSPQGVCICPAGTTVIRGECWFGNAYAFQPDLQQSAANLTTPLLSALPTPPPFQPAPQIPLQPQQVPFPSVPRSNLQNLPFLEMQQQNQQPIPRPNFAPTPQFVSVQSSGSESQQQPTTAQQQFVGVQSGTSVIGQQPIAAQQQLPSPVTVTSQKLHHNHHNHSKHQQEFSGFLQGSQKLVPPPVSSVTLEEQLRIQRLQENANSQQNFQVSMPASSANWNWSTNGSPILQQQYSFQGNGLQQAQSFSATVNEGSNVGPQQPNQLGGLNNNQMLQLQPINAVSTNGLSTQAQQQNTILGTSFSMQSNSNNGWQQQQQQTFPGNQPSSFPNSGASYENYPSTLNNGSQHILQQGNINVNGSIQQLVQQGLPSPVFSSSMSHHGAQANGVLATADFATIPAHSAVAFSSTMMNQTSSNGVGGVVQLTQQAIMAHIPATTPTPLIVKTAHQQSPFDLLQRVTPTAWWRTASSWVPIPSANPPQPPLQPQHFHNSHQHHATTTIPFTITTTTITTTTTTTAATTSAIRDYPSWLNQYWQTAGSNNSNNPSAVERHVNGGLVFSNSISNSRSVASNSVAHINKASGHITGIDNANGGHILSSDRTSQEQFYVGSNVPYDPNGLAIPGEEDPARYSNPQQGNRDHQQHHEQVVIVTKAHKNQLQAAAAGASAFGNAKSSFAANTTPMLQSGNAETSLFSTLAKIPQLSQLQQASGFAKPGQSCKSGERCAANAYCDFLKLVCVCRKGFAASAGTCKSMSALQAVEQQLSDSNKPRKPAASGELLPESCPLPESPEKCRLPDCFCSKSGAEPPAGLKVENVPQFIVLSFDDPVNSNTIDIYKELFDGRFRNKNGCPIKATFFVSHEWTNYDDVQLLAYTGHEIAANSITHQSLGSADVAQWRAEMDGLRRILQRFARVSASEVVGIRAPLLATAGDTTFDMMKANLFSYDNSMMVDGGPDSAPLWPMTLDFGLPWDCQQTDKCPKRPHSGIWEIPLNQFYGQYVQEIRNYKRGSMVRAAMGQNETQADIVQMLRRNFLRSYKSNKAPYFLNFNSDFLNALDDRGSVNALGSFIEEVLQLPDVWFLTAKQLIEWMRNPVPSGVMPAFPGTQCRERSTKVPMPCASPNRCSFRTPQLPTGEHQFKTCVSCPRHYPWLHNPDGN